MALASKIVQVTDDGQGDLFERFEEALDEFLETPTIRNIVNINYQQFMVGSTLSNIPRVQLVAFIVVEYDQGMQEELNKQGEEDVSINQ